MAQSMGARTIPYRPTPRATEQTRRAIQLHRAGKLEEARVIYRKVLKEAPRHADAWHFHGLLLHQTGDTAGAIRDVRRALEYVPDYADAIANLAILHLDQGDFEQCQACLSRVLELTPDAMPPRVTIARLLQAHGRLTEAETAFREALERDLSASDPEIPTALHAGLAETLIGLARHEEALVHFGRAVELTPRSMTLQTRMGNLLCRMGRYAEAAERYRAMLEHDPEDTRARHMLAACGGSSIPVRAEDDYIKTLFDEFSASFDQNLATLGYRAPELLQATLESRLGDACHDLELLDAGCGTGLYGAQARPYCSRLVGVDLSAGMLGIARRRKLYDEIHEAELTSWLCSHPNAFDVIVSADTLCYFGALGEAAQAAHSALRPAGWFLFTVEHHPDPSAEFVLQHHGRYAHTEAYVGRVLARAGFQSVEIVQDTLRLEGGVPVPGLVVSARASPA